MPKPKKSLKAQAVGKDKLTGKERKFCDEYLIDFNASRAARTVGYSSASAPVIASHLLTKVNISRYIGKQIAKNTEKADIQQEKIFRELKSMAFSKITNFMDVDGNDVILKNTSEIDKDFIGAIQGYTQTKTADGGSLSIKLHDKIKALEMLAKYAKLFKEADDDRQSDIDRLRKNVTSGVLDSLQANSRGRKS